STRARAAPQRGAARRQAAAGARNDGGQYGSRRARRPAPPWRRPLPPRDRSAALTRRRAGATLALLLAGCAGPTLQDTPGARVIPTPAAVVEEILDLAAVTPGDVVYDLGSGDGRIVIAAARRGARAIGIEIDAQFVQDSRDRAFIAGLGERTTFVWQDVLKSDLRAATVVTLYLFPEL